MKIIINADDFGLSHDVNMAIVEAFEKGYITNTTIMTNMPGFDEAIELSKKHGFFDKVGIHINLFEGKPISSKMKNAPLFYKGDEMTSYRFFHQSGFIEKFPPPFSSFEQRNAIREEVRMQIYRYLDAGFPEMHADSHGHSHTFPVVWNAVSPLLKEFKFKTVRKSLNLPRPHIVKGIYKSFFNNKLSRTFGSTQCFTSGAGFFACDREDFSEIESLEIMVHPVYDELSGSLINLGNNPDFEPIMEKISHMSGIDLIGYNIL